MLELKNIVKDYVSSNNVTHALKGISVNFRRSEFVSILGASGCGKTTTLNIIGGLDRYTSGDLIINGKSTKDYTDRDWDTYRNHSIGFIFQSYNLISHQNILKNVELALTISGFSKEERKERALKALETVGLSGMEKKKPNQLSGGQCQRVAIARALINNPEILLADEPTGALDSETSVQIMNLLKEVAKDRLVIMVTHNPELANTYSTRIITMSDGLLLNDTNPFSGGEIEKKKKTSKGNKKKSSMSLLTAVNLSFSNLFSKLKRTILVTIAGSIGIIGVSTVLSVSQGIKDYIGSMQNDLLSSYPIEIAEESVDYTSLMTAFSDSNKKTTFKFDPKDPKVGVDSMVEYLMSAYKDITSIKTNTIDKNLLAFINAIPEDAVGARRYNYGIDITNNIFTDWTIKNDEAPKKYSLNGLTQSYISELKTVEGFSEYASYVNLFTDFMKQAPDNVDYVLDQYDVIAGKTPTFSENELVFVVDKNTTLTDILLAEMGIYRREDFINIATNSIDIQNIIRDENLTTEEKNAELAKLEDKALKEFEYSEILNKKYTYYTQNVIYKEGLTDDEKLVTNASFYDTTGNKQFSLTYNEDYKTWEGSVIDASTYSSKDISFKETENEISIKEFGETLDSLTEDEIINSIIVQQLMEEYGISEELARGLVKLLKSLDLSNINEYKILTHEESSGNKYVVLVSEESNVGFIMYQDGEKTESKDDSYTGIIVSMSGNIISTNVPPKGEYTYSAEVQESWGKGFDLKVTSILRLKEGMNFGCLSRGVYYSKAFADKFMDDAEDGKVTLSMKEFIGSEEEKERSYDAYMTYSYIMHDGDNETILKKKASVFKKSASSSLAELFASYLQSDNAQTDINHLRSLSGLKTTIGYKDEAKTQIQIDYDRIPISFSIFPTSFEKKDVVTDYLDSWNSDETITLNIDDQIVTLQSDQREQLNYDDTIELIIYLINTLIDAVTAALVAFTSLSLLVSCFMIAVITYISVVERIKEIGIIRSLGGRKRDVANLFVMETLLTGLFSGVFGIAMTGVLSAILNIIIVSLFGIKIAHLTFLTAIIMIGVSVGLSVLSGLIPSQSAAKKDPVVALRSNE